MNRPRNRQSSRGNGSPSTRRENNQRGGGRQVFRPRPDSSSRSGPVPSMSQLEIGTPVSIVLKQDQPTGREVQGSIAEILTNGDHPHGIKVRLTDGRVGRVQRLATKEEAEAGTSTQQLGRNGESTLQVHGSNGEFQARGPGTVTYHDARTDGYDYEYSRREDAGLSLEDYVVQKPRRGRRNAAKSGNSSAEHTVDAEQRNPSPRNDTAELTGTPSATLTATTTVCPVCPFEGDEDAVSHHVTSHFK
jgi:uncharacterized repeat protein (TIGR03833 family)